MESLDYKKAVQREHEGYYDIDKAMQLTTKQIKNYIFLRVSCGQAVPGCLSLSCLRDALIRKGEFPIGYHNT